MERNDIFKVYDVFLKQYEYDCANGVQTKLDDEPWPVEKQLSYQPMFNKDDIENIKNHSFDDIDTSIKFIVFYSYYILSEPDLGDILQFITDETGLSLGRDSEFVKAVKQYSEELV